MRLTYNDEWHTYRLDKKACKSVTAIAKLPEDTFNLERWKQAQIAVGLATSDHLIKLVRAAKDDRKKLPQLCTKAMDNAGAGESAELGTAAHRIIEGYLKGEEVYDDAESRRIIGTWNDLLDRAGLDVVPEFVERIVVYPERHICGKLDVILRRRSDGRLVVGDLKTGKTAPDYPHAIAIQMALYANAPMLAFPLEHDATERFQPWPPNQLDTTAGIIVHMPADSDGGVYEVDLNAGWHAVETVCWPILEWRSTKGLVRPYERVDPLGVRRAGLLALISTSTPKVQQLVKDSWPYPGLSLRNPAGWDVDKLDHIAGMLNVATGFPNAELRPA